MSDFFPARVALTLGARGGSRGVATAVFLFRSVDCAHLIQGREKKAGEAIRDEMRTHTREKRNGRGIIMVAAAASAASGRKRDR